MMTCIKAAVVLLLVCVNADAYDVDLTSQSAVELSNWALGQINADFPDSAFRLVKTISMTEEVGDDGNLYEIEMAVDQTSCSPNGAENVNNPAECPPKAGGKKLCKADVFYAAYDGMQEAYLYDYKCN